MSNKERLALAIFGHAKPVLYSEYLYLNLFSGAKLKPKQSQEMLRKFCFSGWVERLHVGGSKETDQFILTPKGDRAFREAQIDRGGDYRYFKYVDRNDLNSVAKWSSEKPITENEMINNLDPSKPAQAEILGSIMANKRRTAKIMNEIKEARKLRGY